MHHSVDTWLRFGFVSKIPLMTFVTIGVVHSFARLRILVILIAGCFAFFVAKTLPVAVLTGGAYRATGGIYLQPNIPDGHGLLWYFDHVVRAHLFVSWLHPYKEQKLVIVGERRMAVFDDVRQAEKLQLYDKKIELIDGQFVIEKPKPQPIEFPADEPLLLECRHFLECMETGASPKTDGVDAWRVLKVLEASQRSLSINGEPVQLQPNHALEAVGA